MGEDHASLVAAGIALNTLLAVFPALGVAVLIYGLFSSPAGVAADIRPFIGILPPDAAKLLQDQLQSLAAPPHVKLGIGAVLSALLAFWSARQGIVALMTATNIAYYERERRGFFTQIAISLGFTLAAVAAFLVMLVLGVAVPLVLQVLPLGPAAATLWLAGSVLFELYVKNFSNYGVMYGALGGAVVLIMWFYLGGIAVVLGAQINAEMEHQTAVDTTEGPAKPMGQRGAYVADTLGRTPD